MKSLFSMDKKKFWMLRVLPVVNIIMLVLALVLLFYFCSQRIFIKEFSLLSSEASKRDFCHLVFNQIIEKKLSKKIVEEGLYEMVTAENYKELDLTGKQKVQGIWSNDEKCKIYLTGELGPRVFDLFLEGTDDYPFYYLVTKIREHELFDKEEGL